MCLSARITTLPPARSAIPWAAFRALTPDAGVILPVSSHCTYQFSITLADVVLPLQWAQVGQLVAAVWVNVVDFPSVLGVAVAVELPPDPGTANVLSPNIGIVAVTWWLSGASLLVSVVALWFSVFKPAPTVILQQPPAAAAKAPQLASPLQETKKPRR